MLVPSGSSTSANCAPVLVLPVGLERDFLAKDKFRRSLLGLLSVGLALLGAVDAIESDAFSAIVVQDFDGVQIRKRFCCAEAG